MTKFIFALVAFAISTTAASSKEAFQYYSPQTVVELTKNPHGGTWFVEAGDFREEYVVHTHSTILLPGTHEHFADHITVIDGSGTAIVGGTVKNNKQTAPGEWGGSEIVGGKNYDLAAGSILIIPAGIPHQFVVSAGSHLTLTVVKHRE